MSSKVKKAQEPSSLYSIGVTDINVVETTFKWVVNNFSFYQKGFRNKLNSPVFETTNNNTITWRIELDPSTSQKFNNLMVNLKLVQSSLPKVHAIFEFMIINKDGQPEKSTSAKSATFHKGMSKSSKILMSHGYFEKNVQKILPNDTLTILCKIKANLDQGATNTIKAKAVPKQKSKAQCLPDQAGVVPAVKKANTVGPEQTIQAQLNSLTETTAKMDIEDLPKLNSEIITAAVASSMMSTNVYPPMNFACIYTPPSTYQPGIASFRNNNIDDSLKPNNQTQAGTVTSNTMSTNVAANIYPSMNFASTYIPPPYYPPGIASFTNTNIENSPKPSNTTQAGAVASNTMSINVAANVYLSMNTAYAACSMPPPSYQPGTAPFTSTATQYTSNLGPSGSSAAPPPNSTPSPYCRYCNYLLRNCICNFCKYCKFLSQYCKCVHCKICNFRVKECACICCEYCGDFMEDCECEYCFYCQFHVEECDCDTCEYCDSHMQECECPYCPDCDFHIEECDCDDNYCTYCNEHLEFCECDYCPDCDCPNDDCECNEFGNNHFYY